MFTSMAALLRHQQRISATIQLDLDRAILFVMSGPASDLPGDTVLCVARFIRECHSLADVIRICEQAK